MNAKLKFLATWVTPSNNKIASACYATLLAAGLTIAVTQPASASNFSSSSGSLAATASFNVVSGNLQVILTNTSTADALVPTDILTAIFFDVIGNPTLTPISSLI